MSNRMSFTKENYELYKAGYKAQAERIRELERENRELKSKLRNLEKE